MLVTAPSTPAPPRQSRPDELLPEEIQLYLVSWRRVVANRAALLALVIGALSLLAVIEIPALAHLLRLVPLSAADWALVFGLASVPAVVGQTVKVARTWPRRSGTPV